VLEFMQLAMRHGDRFGTNKAYLKLLMPGRNVCHSYAAGLCTRIDRDLANKIFQYFNNYKHDNGANIAVIFRGN
jgi:hypothetical protein